MKIVTVVGARPQFIKAAALSRVIRPQISEVLVHTGQHYDSNMSDIFFDELGIPHPDYNLGVGSGSHARQTAEMLIGIEEILLKEKPDYILVYGDTNSTLAGALAAVKIHIPVIHVEAGLRSYNMAMPEEINRILTDRISDVLFCPSEKAVAHLKDENQRGCIYDVGDVMCDAVKYYGSRESGASSVSKLLPLFGECKNFFKWYMATVHRAENTDDIGKIEQILSAFDRLDAPVIFPVHPRTKQLITAACKKHEYANVYFCEPMGYTDMLTFTKNAVKVITDSGGLQKEAYILGTPCVTIREQTEWTETLRGNWNVLAHPITDDIIAKVRCIEPDVSKHADCYGDGHAAEKIKDILLGDYAI